jgi:hypothetical protein
VQFKKLRNKIAQRRELVLKTEKIDSNFNKIIAKIIA